MLCLGKRKILSAAAEFRLFVSCLKVVNALVEHNILSRKIEIFMVSTMLLKLKKCLLLPVTTLLPSCLCQSSVR